LELLQLGIWREGLALVLSLMLHPHLLILAHLTELANALGRPVLQWLLSIT